MRDVVKLPYAFDPVRLQQDLDRIPPALWVDHFIPENHDGGWSVLALYSPTGAASFVLPMQTDQFHLTETPAICQSPYLQEVVESFECPKRSVRLSRLRAGSIIKEHTDSRLSYADGGAPGNVHTR